MDAPREREGVGRCFKYQSGGIFDGEACETAAARNGRRRGELEQEAYTPVSAAERACEN